MKSLLASLVAMALALPGEADDEPKVEKPEPVVAIVLGPGQATAKPFRQGSARTGGGNIHVTQPAPDTISVTMTGVGLVAFLVLGIGGTLLNRQIQSARSDVQTTAKSSPNGKTLPKTTDAEKISQTDKSPAAKTENLTLDNPSPDKTDDFQPRETDEKTSAPTKRDKKRTVKETPEQNAAVNKTETVSKEIPGKKTETKPPTDKKTDVRNQSPTKTDGSTRPRIVKTQ
mgnify:CR=1 FL=1